MLPSWDNDTLAAAVGPAVTGTSTHVVPPSSEYWNFATATSSVADSPSVCGAVMRQLPFPFGDAANVAVASTGATVSAASAGEATAKLSAVPTTAAGNADDQRRRLDSLMDMALLATQSA